MNFKHGESIAAPPGELEKAFKAAQTVLSKGDRVELIPTKEGVKVVSIHREPVKQK